MLCVVVLVCVLVIGLLHVPYSFEASDTKQNVHRWKALDELIKKLC